MLLPEVKAPALPALLPDATPGQIANALAAASVRELLNTSDTPRGRRNAAIVAVLVFLDIRPAQLASLRVGDVNMSALTVRGLSIARPFALIKAIAVYYVCDRLEAPDDAPFLLGSRQNSDELSAQPMTRTTISQEVAREGRRVGVRVTPLILRRTGQSLKVFAEL